MYDKVTKEKDQMIFLQMVSFCDKKFSENVTANSSNSDAAITLF